MDRPVKKMHVNELKQFLASLKCLTVKAQLIAKWEILQRKDIPVDKNTAQAQACAPTKKVMLNFSEKMKRKRTEKDVKKCLDCFPQLTYHSVIKYVCTSGKSIQQTPEYMVMKPFERGVNLFINSIYRRPIVGQWIICLFSVCIYLFIFSI